MKLQKIYLKNYRNYDDILLELNNNLNIIIGDNAQGKTNLLESIYVLAVTKSFLSISDKNLINFNSRYSMIKGIVDYNGSYDELELLINENGKVVKINKKEIKKLSDYISKMNVILFSSDSIRIFKDSPSCRRKYFNIQISQINKIYLANLNNYNLVLRQRNEFLKIININKESDMNYLDILNDKYIGLSIVIYNFRRKYVDLVNKYIDGIFSSITGLEGLKMIYTSNVSNLDKDMFKDKLKSNLSREIQYKITFIGPNRDDFYFDLNGKNLSLYGSNGQIRSAVLALKLAEVKLFMDVLSDTPILLLDDIFSELDIDKRNKVIKYLDNDIQTIVTTTDIENIDKNVRNKANVYKIENGKIISREIISSSDSNSSTDINVVNKSDGVSAETKLNKEDNKDSEQMVEKTVKNFDIVINNAFALANKELKNSIVNKWRGFSDYVHNKEFSSIVSYFLDSTVCVVGEKDIIIAADFESVVDNACRNLTKLELLFNLVMGKFYNLAFVLTDEWNVLRDKYVSDVKSGKKYNYIEPNVENDDIIVNETSDLPDVVSEANDIFGDDIVEIK